MFTSLHEKMWNKSVLKRCLFCIVSITVQSMPKIIKSTSIIVFIGIEAPGTKTRFWGRASFKKKSKDKYIIDVKCEYHLDYQPMSPGH